MTRWPRRRPGHPYLAGSPLLIAHRGGARLAPENTVASFRNAVDMWGSDMLEMDVRATRDGEIVVIHDEDVARTTEGTGLVAELTWACLRELDAGYRFQDLEGVHTFRGKGVGIPRFEEVLEELPKVRLNVEAKDGRSAVGLVQAVLRHGAQDRVLVAAEWERNRRRVRGYGGPWGASRRQLAGFLLAIRTPLGRYFTPGCDVLQVPEVHRGIRILTRPFLTEAHRRNLPVHVWTVDEQEDMRRLLALGVDGIQTDRPDLLARILTEVAGRPLPPFLRDRSPCPAGPGASGGEEPPA
jgi:glycerophosphoryl diester phosphodiesterase